MTLPWYAAAAARAALPIPTSVCSSFVCRKEREQKKKRKRYGRQCLGFLTFQQMLMHAIAHCGCRDTVRESVLEGSARNIPCRTWDSNPRQYCAWLFSGTLYRLSYRRPLESRQERREDCCLQGQLSVLALIWVSVPPPFRSTAQEPKQSI